jgi:hypothetical protein
MTQKALSLETFDYALVSAGAQGGLLALLVQKLYWYKSTHTDVLLSRHF